MWIAEPEGFYFHTGAAKNLYRQLKANPRVEIYFHASGEGGGRMMRASGIAEFVSDLALRKRLFSERPFLRTLVKDETDPELILFRVVHGEAWFWTMRDNMREAQIPRVPF
jgi:pyridoxamine 5'-phosphate oxidase